MEVLFSWGWNTKFLKTKTYTFAYIAPETDGDYISVVLFVFMGCALEGKMQIPSESWDAIVMVHNLIEITMQIQSPSREQLAFIFYTCSPAFRAPHSVSETTSLCF